MTIRSYDRRITIIFICCALLFIVGCNKEQHTSGAQGFSIDDDVPFDEKDYQPIVAANNTLGIDLIRTIDADEQQNRFISPLSLFSALSMAYLGADGETKEEIAQIMHMDALTDEHIQQGHAALYDLLSSLPEAITLHTANALWVDNTYSTQDEYAALLDRYYNATFQSDDFSQASTVDHINTWIEEQTNGLIKDMLEAPLKEDVVLMLLNTLYFQGNWMHPFNADQTEEHPFHTMGGAKEVPMMVLSEDLYYTENDDYQAVILPYGEGEIEMNIFLPKESRSIDEVIDLIDDLDWHTSREQLVKQDGTIYFPSFELEFETSLNESLQQLGMQRAFSAFAEFPFMVEGDDGLMIGDVQQKSRIIVDEVGTEAASATSIEMIESSIVDSTPFMMEVNRPFFFTITEAESGIVLFMGAVNEPSSINSQ